MKGEGSLKTKAQTNEKQWETQGSCKKPTKEHKRKNTNEMHECYAMQILDTKGKTQKPKNKEQWSQKEKQ